MKLAIIDTLGLCYDGRTLDKQGLGGSESAVILISKELARIGFNVTVFNNCKDATVSSPGVYDGVRYIDNADAKKHQEDYDVVIVSRTVRPWFENSHPFLNKAEKRILWLHDTFIEGDEFMEDLVLQGRIDHVFTLSDWHSTYILNADHGARRNFEVLKKSFFQTRNGAVCRIPEIDILKKDRNHFVYNASATKGLEPLVQIIWPEIKKHLPEAHLTVIGGYYRFREGAEPDAQEKTVRDMMESEELAALGVTFTGVISQQKIAEILADASLMLYPSAFPETFGISSLESLLYRTPIVTCEFGALEETAVDLACYKIPYAIVPNGLFPNINVDEQCAKFISAFFEAYENEYLLQQKRYYCDVVKDVAGWDTVALQWKQFFYKVTGRFLPVEEYRAVTRINEKVSRIFGRTNRTDPAQYTSFGPERQIVVVSPVWNAAHWIETHIQSVASQDYDNWKHVIIDDASDDETVRLAEEFIATLPPAIQHKIHIVKNKKNVGCIHNQLTTFENYIDQPDDIVVLLDGDDWLVNNNTIFKYLNDLYSRGYKFTYGSCWSLVDDIPLIAQDYPIEVKMNKAYRDYHFNWKIPYTHLRTFEASLTENLNHDVFKVDGKWMKSGADNPLFYELIEQCEPEQIFCNKELIVNYNDINPLNDYKIRGDEQNQNADRSYGGRSEKPSFSTAVETVSPVKIHPKEFNTVKRILVAIPTNKNIEAETYKSLWDLEVPEGYELDFQYFYGYQVDQIRNLIAEWGKGYDYVLSVDSDIVVPKFALKNMLAANKDIISGLYIQRIPNTHTLEIYGLTQGGGCSNIPYHLVRNRGIVEIAACGMGICLINSRVLRSLDYPHFFYQSALKHDDTVSEDVYFCQKARKAGFKVWADTSIQCRHIGQKDFIVEDEKLERYRDIGENVRLPQDHVAYLEKLSKEINPKVIFDIGSSVLHWSRPARELWPEAKFILFEAMDDVGPYYHEHDFHDFFLGVLSDIPGKHVLFYSDPMNFGGNSYYRETTGFFDGKQVQKVTNSIDNLKKLYGIPNPDLVKMDVQGAELDVLRGAVETFATTQDFILELQHENYNEGAPLADEVIKYMDEAGFDLISNFTRTKVDGDYYFSRRTPQ